MKFHSSLLIASEIMQSTLQIHSTVYHILRPLVRREENQNKIEEASVSFTKTLAQVMGVARMLCFS